jgi:hypothetical protein
MRMNDLDGWRFVVWKRVVGGKIRFYGSFPIAEKHSDHALEMEESSVTNIEDLMKGSPDVFRHCGNYFTYIKNL